MQPSQTLKTTRAGIQPFLVTAIFPLLLSACNWPFDGSVEYVNPPDPDPIDLKSVATSEIKTRIDTTLHEDEDSLEVVVKLRNSEFAPLLLGNDATIELQGLDTQGNYVPVVLSELEILDSGARFKIPSPQVPASYRIKLNRSNNEIIDLFDFVVDGKVSSQTTAINTTFGTGDKFEFTWMSYDSNGLLETVPPGWLRYRLDCGDPFVSWENGGAPPIYGSVDLTEDRGFDTAPTIFDVDDTLRKHNIYNFPCDLYFERVFYVYKESNDYHLFSGSFGSKIGTVDDSANAFGFSINAKIFSITIEAG